MPTTVQYSIRHLMALTVAVAVVAAILGPIVRAWDTDHRTVFAVHAAVAVLFLDGHLWFRCNRRIRAEREAGQVMLVAKPAGSLLRTAGLLVLVAVFVAFLILHSAVISSVSFRSSAERMLSSVSGTTFFLAMWISQLLTRLWWGLGPGCTELCERGLICAAYQFIPYAKITHYRWGQYSENALILVIESSTRNVSIRPDMHEEVERLLDERGVPRRAMRR